MELPEQQARPISTPPIQTTTFEQITVLPQARGKPAYSSRKSFVPRTFDTLADIVLSLVDLLQPPERLSVSNAAEKYVYLKNMGSYVGPFRNATVPYMVEPANELTSTRHSGVVFVGSAQSGKTQGLILNWVAYSVVADPMDMIVYSPSMASSRDFSMRRVDRMHRHSPAVGQMLSAQRDSDNKFDKHYLNGMMLTLSWPSAVEMAGKPVPRVALTDYDRMPDDIDGEGSGYDLSAKRTTTFGSFAMALAESSPSREITDPTWIAATAHEAPPTTGILALYNRGDRRRWYWPCPHCGRYFEGEFSMLEWDDLGNDMDSAKTVRMTCPHNGCKIVYADRHEMNLWGTWVKDGEAVDERGIKYGEGAASDIASFWSKGVAAAFVTWPKLIMNYIAADREYVKTGSEDALRKFYNTDLSEIYYPKSLESERIPEHLKARSEKIGIDEENNEKLVPEDVRFLVANVDVQKNMFVVQVHGVLPGTPFDVVVVDRFNIQKSTRLDSDGEHLWIKPSAYLEDWDLIIDQVMEKSYPLCDGSGRHMQIKLTTCDSGGKEGVTTNAYNFYRRLRKDNLHGRFHLVKGDPKPGNPRARVTYPDSNNRASKFAGARGDVPILLLNSNSLKDALAGRLECISPGKGMYRFPNWLPDWWYQEMCSEVRTSKGWENPSHTRNEAWDLSYYCIGACVSKLLLVEKIDWLNPPGWAAPWERNDLISKADAPKRFAQQAKTDYDFAKLAEALA